MIFTKTKFSGLYIIEPNKIEDERGFFARMWDKEKFSEIGLKSEFVQTSISLNKKKGTIRGMHYQSKPYEEEKIVRCVKGGVFDVVIDIRSDSKTFKEWFSIELNEDNYKMLYIPKGFAHGFQTLEDNSEIYYQISEYYNFKFSKGIKWNDEAIQIKWPLEITMISDKDLSNPIFSEY